MFFSTQLYLAMGVKEGDLGTAPPWGESEHIWHRKTKTVIQDTTFQTHLHLLRTDDHDLTSLLKSFGSYDECLYCVDIIRIREVFCKHQYKNYNACLSLNILWTTLNLFISNYIMSHKRWCGLPADFVLQL